MANRRLEEIKLLTLCMASDNREAFSRLVEIHQEGLRRFLLNLTGGDESLADDLAQETFIKAWLAVRSFHGLSGFKTWLYRIAINEFSTFRRQTSRFNYTSVDASAMSILDDTNHGGATDARMDVEKIIKMLPEKERIVVLLFYIEELPIKEIVKITAMPDGTVKSHLSRARQHLAKFVER
ncbi:MAG: RNA polymerase sigma factor [Muribaculaceae bacterium]|nr:RNA polymerase sigma factor [Muribaculaceae bacterium]